MKALPPEPATAGQILPWARAVQQYLRGLQFSGGPGILVSQHSGGITISSLPPRGRPKRDERPFEVRIVPDPDNPTGPKKVRVAASTLAGGTASDLDFDDDGYRYFSLPTGKAILLGYITIDPDTGDLTTRDLSLHPGDEMPADTTEDFHVAIAAIDEDDTGPTATNWRFGPIGVKICRNWFVPDEEPHWGVTWL